ncbi:MAG: hypothetical protein NZ954_00450 [Thermofilaceae archaeon]|nr:hypothetical protein [Thermofilaceae archaeon]MCX8180350.1 hypothetical protein [Thermofilaceae archaeon]MDW8003885.1 hypothetical protein [Thermofilaceae archaeon]
MRHKGQLALIATLILAATLIALTSLRTPHPYVAYERGHLQAAHLIHIARVCFSRTCDCNRLQQLVVTLQAINGSEPLRMYPTFSLCTESNPMNSTFRSDGSYTTEYAVKFTIQTLSGAEYVNFQALIQSLGVDGTYVKTVTLGDAVVSLRMLRVRLKYSNSFKTPFFNATVCPRIEDPEKLADLTLLAPCEWLVGVPLDISGAKYVLKDEWGVVIPVFVGGN